MGHKSLDKRLVDNVTLFLVPFRPNIINHQAIMKTNRANDNNNNNNNTYLIICVNDNQKSSSSFVARSILPAPAMRQCTPAHFSISAT